LGFIKAGQFAEDGWMAAEIITAIGGVLTGAGALFVGLAQFTKARKLPTPKADRRNKGR
jgi:hypothetical protein